MVWCDMHHGNAAELQHRTSCPHAYDTLQVCCPLTDKGKSYLPEGSAGNKCFQLHMKAVELLGLAHLLPPAGLLGSIALHGPQAVAQQIGPPLCHDGCTNLPQLLFIAEEQTVRSLLTIQKTM